MRQYRGLTKEGKWVYGYYVFCRNDHYILPINNVAGFDERWLQEGADEDGWIKVIPETVGQFTGLKDKNGKEIYEGDILRGYNNCGRVVEWEGIGWNPFEDDVIDTEDSVRYEIIGNIHQHPNLLEQK